MRAPLERFLSLAVLLLWMVPSAAAAATALHVAFDHHGAHHAEQTERIEDPVEVATHGHHHDLSVPEHEHEASLTSPAPLPKPVVSSIVVASAPLEPGAADQQTLSEIASRRGPPRALFTAHCSLLL